MTRSHRRGRSTMHRSFRMKMSARDVRKYRIRCATEDAYVYTWSDLEPSVCPNGGDHIVETDATVQIESIAEDHVRVNNMPLTQYGRLRTVEDSVLINLRPGTGISALRDIVTTNNGGQVISAIGSPTYELRVSGTGSVARIRSAQRARFMAGTCGEVAIGGHFPTRPIDDQRLKFGLFDDDNGFYFVIDATDLWVVVMTSEKETKVRRVDFNLDCLDGRGPSGHTIDPFKGYIWTITFGMFGYGAIEFAIVAEDAMHEQRTIPMHRHYTQSEPAVAVPNLPITVALESGASDGDAVAYFTGRKFCVQGRFEPVTRQGSVFSTGASPSPGPASDWTPVLCIRRKAAFSYVPVRLYLAEAFCAPGNVSVLKVATGVTVPDDAEWRTPEGHAATETAVEVCSAAPNTGGICVWQALVRAHTVAPAPTLADVDFYLIESDAVALFVRDMGDMGDISANLRWAEEW